MPKQGFFAWNVPPNQGTGPAEAKEAGRAGQAPPVAVETSLCGSVEERAPEPGLVEPESSPPPGHAEPSGPCSDSRLWSRLGLGGLWRTAQENLPVVVGVAVAIGIAGFALLGGQGRRSVVEEPAASAAVEPVGPRRFPEPDFSEARRGALTDVEVTELIRRYSSASRSASLEQPAREGLALATGEQPSARQRLYTEQELALAIEAARQAERHQRVASRGSAVVHRTRTVEAVEPPEPKERTRRYFALPPKRPPSSERSTGQAGAQRLALAVATRIPAVLDIGISSAQQSPVLARTQSEIVTLDGQSVPAGSVLTGYSSRGNERLFVEFRQLSFGGQTWRLKGVATVGREVGLPAVVRRESVDSRTGTRVAEGALETLKGVVSGAAERLSGGIIRGTDEVFSEAQREYEIDRTEYLEVPAGIQFDIVITEAGGP